MTPRRVLVPAIVAVVLVVLVAPSAGALVAGRPLEVDCGGLEPELCDETWGSSAPGDVFAPVTWVKLEPRVGTCGPHTFGYWWPFFDPFAITVHPLC